MSNIKKYNYFILLSMLSRNIGEFMSSVFLYKNGFSIRNIFLYYIILYFIGFIVSFITLKLINKMKISKIFMISSLFYSLSFLFLFYIKDNIIYLIIYAFIYSISSFSYHIIRHYLAIKINNKNISTILIMSTLGISIGTFIFTFLLDKYPYYYLGIIIFIISFISYIIIRRISVDIDSFIVSFKNIKFNNSLFIILEQGKIINLTLQPLYLYICISNKFTYLGIFNIVVGLSSVVCIYLFNKNTRYFKYFNILFSIILLLKINIDNKYIILLLAFFEGLGLKIFESISARNLYSNSKDFKNCLLGYEFIASIIKIFIFIISYLFDSIIIPLYLSIIMIFLVSFIRVRYID